MKKPRIHSILLVLCFLLAWSTTSAAEGPKEGKGLGKNTSVQHFTFFLVNNVFSQYSNNLKGAVDLTTEQNSGFEWPKGSSKFAVYMDGFIYGGYYRGTNASSQVVARKFVNGSAYRSGMNEGSITQSGTGKEPVDAQFQNAGDASARVFRVRPDINPYDSTGSAISAAAKQALIDKIQTEEVALIQRYRPYTAQQLYDQYVLDWNEWPASKGAPFQYGAGRSAPAAYDPTKDIPGLPGSDQTLWSVCNDMNIATANAFAGANPTGIEIQRTVWGYNRQGALGNMLFMRYRFINKSGAPVDTCYAAMWSDIDLGYSYDDFVGCDINRSLGFDWNGKGFDQVYGDAPPSSGYAFFQGPAIPSLPTDSAVFDMKYVHGKKNLKMTSFNMFINGGGIYSDPPQGNSTAARDQWWNLLSGRIGQTGGPWVTPTGDTTKFVLSGDPVTGQGWLDGSFAPPGDRRILMTSGPFTLQPNDTQEVVVSTMVAQGADRLSSLTALRAACDESQAAYNLLFVLPKSCPQPNVTVTPMDGSILLTWGDPADIKTTEQDYNADPASKGYTFEAYKVYQTQTQAFNNPKVVATYDIATDAVMDNNGVQHYINITSDKFTSRPLVNGTPYYFGVSTVAYNPASFPILLEKAPTIVQIVPQTPAPGVRVSSMMDDTVGSAHTAGIADATVSIKVQNPLKVTGDDYQIQIMYTDSVINPNTGTMTPNYKWQVYDVTKSTVVGAPFLNYANDATNPIVDGLNIGFKASPFYTPGTEIAKWTYTPASHLNWTGVNNGLQAFGGGLDIGENFFGSSLTGDQINQSIEIRIDSTNFSKAAGTGASKAYMFARTAASGGAPYVGFFPQPLSVWNVTNAASPVQIDLMFLDQTTTPATYDSVWAPGPGSGNREYFWEIDEAYTATAKAAYTGSTVSSACAAHRVVYNGWFTYTSASKAVYQNGDVFRIDATKTLTTADRWAFTTSGKQQVSSLANQKDDAKIINVFPNPYFGFQPLETTRYGRFVTFNHMPQKATIRIFTLAGQLVRSLAKDDASQFAAWDLKNSVGIPVASGVYVVHIDLPDVGASKILKLSVIQPQQILDHY